MFSVSGNSPNLLEAAKAAKKIGLKIVSLTGFNGGKLSKLSDLNLNFNFWEKFSKYAIVLPFYISFLEGKRS